MALRVTQYDWTEKLSHKVGSVVIYHLLLSLGCECVPRSFLAVCCGRLVFVF